MNDKRVMVAMSGGVDSTAAAYILKSKGYECIGITLKLQGGCGSGGCCLTEDARDARIAAQQMGIPHYIFDFSKLFEREVKQRFAEAYENGLTPNPCVECNKRVKLGELLKWANLMDCAYAATGHYARISRENGVFRLLSGLDETKDQSYALYKLGQYELSRLMFPLGGMSKEEARNIAFSGGLRNAGKKDSQDICFVPDGDYAAFVRRQTGREGEPGDFIDTEGKILGRHKGIINYTIGQRKGLGIWAGRPLYVLKINPETGAVTLGDSEELYSRALTAVDFNWISGRSPGSIRVLAKIRYRQAACPASAVEISPGKVVITFDEPQRAVTPGQAAVLYAEGAVVGGGTISR